MARAPIRAPIKPTAQPRSGPAPRPPPTWSGGKRARRKKKTKSSRRRENKTWSPDVPPPLRYILVRPPAGRAPPLSARARRWTQWKKKKTLSRSRTCQSSPAAIRQCISFRLLSQHRPSETNHPARLPTQVWPRSVCTPPYRCPCHRQSGYAPNLPRLPLQCWTHARYRSSHCRLRSDGSSPEQPFRHHPSKLNAEAKGYHPFPPTCGTRWRGCSPQSLSPRSPRRPRSTAAMPPVHATACSGHLCMARCRRSRKPPKYQLCSPW